MRSLEAAIEIHARPEEVFDLIHDYARRLNWVPFLREARLLDGAPAAAQGVKTLCTARARFGGLAMERCTSPSSPARGRGEDDWGPAVLEAFAASLRQEDIGAGCTRVTYRFNFATRPRWLRAIADPLAAALFRRETRRRLEALKIYLERLD